TTSKNTKIKTQKMGISPFFSHLKEEMFNNDSFTSINELRIAVNQYIHWYNTERMQQRLGGMTPNEYRQHALTNTG
ncbi:IS3 family transposase, partial [Varibaculum massiliense]|uniref:IS3 family transposase n=1 Tax=Varibaculum massiliense TaxID=1852372 RepID=UPI00288AD0A4